MSSTAAVVGAYRDSYKWGSISTYVKEQDVFTIQAGVGASIGGSVADFSQEGSRLIPADSTSIEWSNSNLIGETITLQSINGTDWIISGEVDNLLSAP